VSWIGDGDGVGVCGDDDGWVGGVGFCWVLN